MQRGLQIPMEDILTPLSWTISNGYTLAFEFLAATGLSPEETMQNAIWVAATEGHRGIVEKYLQFSEFFLILDKDKLNCDLLVLAASNRWPSVLKYLLNDVYVQEAISTTIVTSLPEKGVLF